MKPKLIYCAGGNKRFAEIAINAGFLYGAQIPRDKPHYPIYFADQDWKKPNRKLYMENLRHHRPQMATVMDLEDDDQFNEIMDWSEEISEISEFIVIIPKVLGIIKKIPKDVNGKHVILGYSVPTKYGATSVPIEEFKGRSVHILGGSPHRQIDLWYQFKKQSDVFSIDGNYTQLIAIRYNKFWTNGDATYAENRWLPRLDEADGKKWLNDAPYEAFHRSCTNVINTWNNLIME